MNSLEEIADSCWEDAERQVNIYESDREEKVRHEFARRLIAALGAQEPVAWVTGGDCHDNGHIDCCAWPSGEFTTPLYAAPTLLVTQEPVARVIYTEPDLPPALEKLSGIDALPVGMHDLYAAPVLPSVPGGVVQHVCGLQGFGALDDVCPACAFAPSPQEDKP